MPFPPETINIDLTDRCNLSCIMCALKYLPKTESDMSYNDFCKIVDIFSDIGVSGFRFTGMGEPLINPHLPEMLKLCKSRGFQTEVWTNGTLGEVLQKIMGLLDTIVFSVDGATDKSYESIRTGSNFNETKKNISNFCHNNLQTRTYISYVITNININETYLMPILCKELGVKNLNLKSLRYMYPYVEINDHNKYIVSLETRQMLDISKLSFIAKENQIQLHFEQNSPLWRTCTAPWTQTNISHNGWVTPCCVMQDFNYIEFGNIFLTDFDDIWNSNKYREFRRKLLSRDPPDGCKKCGFCEDASSSPNKDLQRTGD